MKKVLKKTKMKAIRTVAVSVLALLIGSVSISGLGEKNIGQVIDYIIQSVLAQSDAAYETAEVIRVVDGDTIVAKIDGSEQRVRLIGVNTPESAGQYKNNPQPGGKEASDFMVNLLPQGKTIYLTMDVSDTDKYGRLLRYVWIETPNDTDAREIMVNCILLENGYATLMTMSPDVKYVELFESVEGISSTKTSLLTHVIYNMC